MTNAPETHPFIKAPHRTLVALSIPTLFSLIAEPLTGLVDTAFIARLGAEALAALGVGTITLSSIFWIFNFLSIGTQTEVSQAFGSNETHRSKALIGMGLAMGAGLGGLVALIGYPLTPAIASAMGASGDTYHFAIEYIRIRLVGGAGCTHHPGFIWGDARLSGYENSTLDCSGC